MNLYNILSLKFPEADFTKDIKLADEGNGNGPFIREWNLDFPMPTSEDLDKWRIEFDYVYRCNEAKGKRKYPPIHEQLEMMYDDKINNTSKWVDAIRAVKDCHPLPLE